jgi:hypothetical protein
MSGQVTLMLGVVACGAVLAVGETSLAAGMSEEDCRQFHQECSEARALGYSDAGICNVERLECTTGPTDRPDAGAGRRPRGMDARPDVRPDVRPDPERSIGP